MIFYRWAPVAALTVVALFVALIVALATGYPMRDFDFRGRFLLISAVVLLIWSAQFLAYYFRLWRAKAEPLDAFRSDWPKALPSLLSGSIGVLLVGTYLYALSTLKMMMTAVVPFWADAPLLAVDYALIGDVQLVAGKLQAAMPAIGWFYWSWHFINIIGMTWVLHWRSNEGQRLVLAFMLTWGIGMTFAYLGSSAGPLFTGAYDPQLAPQRVQWMSDALWKNHISQGSMIGSGISAFPSMHVAISVWFAFVLREKGLGWLGTAYAFAIFLCSVLIGWHYILDGVGAALIAWLAYLLAGRERLNVAVPSWRSPNRRLGGA